MDDLGRLSVVITRPLAQACQWRDNLQQQGAESFLLPVLEIVPVAEPVRVQAVKDRILELVDYHKVIFVSQNAVQQVAEWIDRYWPQLPVGIGWYAVGTATARSAAQCGLEVTPAGQAMNSEALLDLPGLQTVKDEKILICRGLGGRTYLGEELRKRGAQVDYCELYQRRLPENAFQQVPALADWCRCACSSGREIVIAVHSGESLQNFSSLLDRAGLAELRQLALLVPGDRVAALAAELGFRRCVVASNATDEAMTRALVALSN